MRLLLIEDDESLIHLLTMTLGQHGYTVDVARDGLTGYGMAQDNPYDLILLDVGLPELDGFTVCTQLRQQGNFTPLILLTARHSTTHELLGLELGADDYVIKPFSLALLLQRIETLLNRNYQTFKPHSGFEETYSRNVYDDDLADELRIIWERTKETTFSRIQDLLDTLQSLEQGILDDNLREKTHRTAHKLGGSLGTFGFEEGSRIAQTLADLFNRPNQSLESYLDKARTLILRLHQVVLATDLSFAQGIHTTHDRSDHPNGVRNGSTTAIVTPGKKPLSILVKGEYILLVDQDPEFTASLCHEASGLKMGLQAVDNVGELCANLKEALPKVLLLNLDVVKPLHDWQMFKQTFDRLPSLPSLVILSEEEGLMNRLKALRLKADIVLQKPATSSQIFAAVSRAINFHERQRVKVLVVDDDTQVTDLLRSLLGKVGFQTEILNDPTQFWEHLGAVQPDLLILDVEMPTLNGLCLCELVRHDFQWSWLPVLFLTGHGDLNTLQEAFSAGADDFITKPIEPKIFINRVVNRWQRSQLYRSQMDTDLLTGIANRNGGSRSLSHLLQLALQTQQPLCLIVLDLDHFKQVNDRYGHEQGDRVLREFGDFLKGQCRNGDVLARWGGEEFILGMLGLSRDDGTKRMTAILERWRSLKFATNTGEQFQVTFSGGVAQYPLDGSDFQILYRTADAALYRAKAAGRNQVLPAS